VFSAPVLARSSAAALLLLLGACQPPPDVTKKPKKACREAEATLDRAIVLGDYARARSLRAGAYAACGPRTELHAQDQRIIDGEANQRALVAAQARDEQELTAALSAFFDFVAEERATPERASARPACDDETRPPPRFCVAKRSLGGVYPIEVRYDRDDSLAFRFTLDVNGPVDCSHVGGSEKQSWRVPLPGGGTITRARCELTGTLAGLTAVVSSSTPSSVHVVSPTYLESDPGARQGLEAP
jgi:hypothetical protein